MSGQILVLGVKLCHELNDVFGAATINTPSGEFEASYLQWDKEKWASILLNKTRLRKYITGLPDVVLVALDESFVDPSSPFPATKNRLRKGLKNVASVAKQLNPEVIVIASDIRRSFTQTQPASNESLRKAALSQKPPIGPPPLSLGQTTSDTFGTASVTLECASRSQGQARGSCVGSVSVRQRVVC